MTIETDRTKNEKTFKEFREKYGITHCLGIIGASNFNASKDDYLLLESAFSILRQNYGQTAIISGGTKGGIPEFAVNFAFSKNIPTVGVLPDAGKKYSLPGLDLDIVVPPPILGDIIWGSETPVLASLVDTVFVFGGEWGTLIEIATIVKNQKYRERKGLPPVKIICFPPKAPLYNLLSDAAENLPYAEQIFIPESPSELFSLIGLK